MNYGLVSYKFTRTLYALIFNNVIHVVSYVCCFIYLESNYNILTKKYKASTHKYKNI